MGKTIRGFNGQPSEPDYPLPADLPFSVAPTQDNGARAAQLARLFHETYERLAPEFGYRTREASAVPWAEVPDTNRSLMIATAAAILANGAAFLPDAAELDRLRGFVQDVIDWADVPEDLRRHARAALAPEGSARDGG